MGVLITIDFGVIWEALGVLITINFWVVWEVLGVLIRINFCITIFFTHYSCIVFFKLNKYNDLILCIMCMLQICALYVYIAQFS